MKSLFKISSIVLALVVILCACSANGKVNIDVNDQSNGVFADMLSFNDIINDVSNVDFYLEPDYSNLTEKVEEDEESSTAIKYYYNGDVLVYADYEGYGEDCFDYYTKSVSGKDLTVKYVDEGDERYCVNIECDDYSVSFSELNKDADLGADTVYATAVIPAENDFSKKVTYAYEYGVAYVNSGMYLDTDGYHYFSAYPVDEEGNIESDDFLKYPLVDSVKAYDKLKEIAVDKNYDCEFAVGTQSTEYKMNDDGTKSWYITCDVSVVFDDEEKANEFAKEYGVTAAPSDTDDTIFVATIPQATIPVSNEFTDFFEFAEQEVNDYYYSTIVLDDEGALKALMPSSAGLSYY